MSVRQKDRTSARRDFHNGIGVLRQLERFVPLMFVDAVGGGSAPVAVHERAGALAAQPIKEPADLARRELQVGGRLIDGQLPGQDMGEHGEAPLRSGIQRDRLPRLHGSEGDKVAVPLARTDSLADDTGSLGCIDTPAEVLSSSRQT